MLDYGWQSDREMWERISKDLLEEPSWHYVGFTEIDAVAVPRGESGIYMLCASPVGQRFPPAQRSGDLFANLLTPIYIGKTTDLQQRFLSHCRNPSPKVGAAGLCFEGSLMFWFHRVPPERLAYDEAILIHCFGPPANERSEAIPASIGNPIPIGTNAN